MKRRLQLALALALAFLSGPVLPARAEGDSPWSWSFLGDVVTEGIAFFGPELRDIGLGMRAGARTIIPFFSQAETLYKYGKGEEISLTEGAEGAVGVFGDAIDCGLFLEIPAKSNTLLQVVNGTIELLEAFEEAGIPVRATVREWYSAWQERQPPPPRPKPKKPCMSCWMGDLSGTCTTPTCPNYGHPHSAYHP